MIYHLLFWFFIFSTSSLLLTEISGSICPKFCQTESCKLGFLDCSDSGLLEIPESPPKGITRVVIRNQNFQHPTLSYRNLSKYGPEDIALKELTIRSCGISDIESESFSHLAHLTFLDLSQNNLRIIKPRTFKALSLKELRLNGNKFIKLTKFSLEGLVVNFLVLSNCGLEELDFESIKEISGHLTKLDLSRNNLKTLSNRFLLLFQRLEELHLDENRLKCDCRLKWLSELIEKQRLSYNSLCHSPFHLNGKFIKDLSSSDFICPQPVLEKIDIFIKTLDSAILSCVSATNSDSTVSWLRKQSNSLISSGSESSDNASIRIHRKNNFDHFTCVVTNENGNVTVDLSIVWPLQLPNISGGNGEKDGGIGSIRLPSIPTNSGNCCTDNPFRTTKMNDRYPPYLFVKQFTLLEMLLSITTTFVITIILFSVIYLILAKKYVRIPVKTQSKSGYDVYSDSQIYDVPHYQSPSRFIQSSPNLINFDAHSHLIDFKTQRPIVADNNNC